LDYQRADLCEIIADRKEIRRFIFMRSERMCCFRFAPNVGRKFRPKSLTDNIAIDDKLSAIRKRRKSAVGVRMVTIQQQIAEKFLAKLAESKEVDADKLDQLRNLLKDNKKTKAEDFIKIFSIPAGGDLK
jgi:hypothetical protein